MLYDKQQIASKLLHWEEFLHEFRLPVWDELPQIELYMDQVIVLLNEYLSYFVYEGNDEKLITAAMVNNYVKMKLVPAPVRKKYGRVHLAYLIMICTLKQTLSMAVVKKMLPRGDVEIVKRDYNQFIDIHKGLSYYLSEQVRSSAKALFDTETATDSDVNDLVVASAVASSFAKLLTGKIIALQLEETPAAEKPERAAHGEKKGTAAK